MPHLLTLLMNPDCSGLLTQDTELYRLRLVESLFLHACVPTSLIRAHNIPEPFV